MIHSAPTLDINGAILSEYLETGLVELNGHTLPAIRAIVRQGRHAYPVIATAHEAGELYAYCLAAREKEIDEINVKVSCTLLPDTQGNLVTVATGMSWFASTAIREKATQNLIQLLGANSPGGDQHFSNRGMLARIRT